jgi:steroid Delta-isomerase
VISRERIRAVVDRHVATVGTADADALAALYAPDAAFEDPAGSAPYVGREAIRAQFASVLTSPRRTELLRVAIAGNEVALLFRATSGDGTSTEVFDVMSFDKRGRIATDASLLPRRAGREIAGRLLE